MKNTEQEMKAGQRKSLPVKMNWQQNEEWSVFDD
jgi:hypothetical protein